MDVMMTNLRLSLALSTNPMTAHIHSGEVTAAGIDWTVTAVHPSEMFWRQLRYRDFDISEMSLSSLAIATSRGNRDWVALPVFTTRRFFHAEIVVREDASVEVPADLVGKRVGVPEYQQTAAVWTRGALQHEFGVTADQMRWVMERTPGKSHGGATDFRPPPGVELTYMPSDTNMAAMLAAGELDAAIHTVVASNLVDRTRVAPTSLPGIRRLFPDPAAEARRYYAATGIYPTNHTVVVRRELLEKHPWIALNVFGAFLRAKEAAIARIEPLLKPYREIGAIDAAATDAIAAADPLPYGLVRQAPIIDALTTYLVEQGLVDHKVQLDQIFAHSTLDL
jgi:4,5-dihydroxyphthalate decarboxylase